MEYTFYKYQGTGNDFIIIDDRLQKFPYTDFNLINQLCERRFGIGADGLILLQQSENYDFKMVYFNADGKEGSLCGNGARCVTAFAKFINCIETKTTFESVSGLHTASVTDNIVSLQMPNVFDIQVFKTHYFLNTGSPHHVEMVEDAKNYDVFNLGRSIRKSEPYNDAGTNVNFVQQLSPSSFIIRTYERGVEDETLSCGTGATAVGIAMHHAKKTTRNSVKIQTQGGELNVQFVATAKGYEKIYLSGPAKQVYSGTIKL